MNATRTIRIAPSVLDADFGCLAQQIAAVEAAGADALHLDVMDGHFVPNLSLGVPIVASIRRHTRLLLDTHLMITDPARYAPAFIEAGAGTITFHIETVREPGELIARIHELGAKAGVALNPDTPAEAVLDLLPALDIVLVMTVWPGFGGQAFMSSCLEKIARLAAQLRPEQWLEVDGGLKLDTVPQAVAAGANTIVAGTAIFREADPGAALRALRRAAERGRPVAEAPA